jgi:hypothetical protein
MTKVSRRAKVLLDGLAHKDLLHPRQNRNAIEPALRTHLRPFALWPRRFVWMEDARSGLRYVAEQARMDRFGATALMHVERAWFLVRRALLAPACLVLAVFAAVAPLGLFVSWLAGDRTGMALRERFGAASAASAIVVAVLLALFYTSVVSLLVRNARRHSAVARAIKRLLAPMRVYWDVVTTVVAGAESDIFYWSHVRKNLPFAAHEEAYRELLTLRSSYITGGQRFPMTQAFEAGLFIYWVRPREVVCVLQPALHVVSGELHREDGPAVEWASGERYWFLHDVETSPGNLDPMHQQLEGGDRREN